MNVILYGGNLAFDEEARNRYWTAEFKRIEADRAFIRARRAALLRRIGLLLGFAAGTSARAVAGDEASETGLTEAGSVPIDSIVGAVEPRTRVLGEPRTRVLGRVPALKRRWKEAWRRLWAEEDLDSLSALPVVRGTDGWYLVDLPHSLLVLEVLRAKGAREVRATAAAGHIASCVEVERTQERPTYRLVDCERGYACCADETGVAV